MAEEQLSIVYSGFALEAGSMEVRELAPSLLAFAALVKEIQRSEHPNDPELSVRVTALRHGSFGIDLQIAHSVFETARHLLFSEPFQEVKNLAEVVGIVYGLIYVIKHFLTRKIRSRRTLPDGQVELTFDDGTVYITTPEVMRAVRSNHVRRFFREWFAPLEKPGIDSVSVSSETHGDVQVEAHELPAFEVPEAKDQVVAEDTTDLYVGIQAPSFEPTNAWRLTIGGDAFWARFEDDSFLQQVADNQAVFAAGDTLRVRLRSEQLMGPSGLSMRRTVEEVYDHIEARNIADVPLPFVDDEEES